jgi:hypothetical protein
MKIYGFVKKRSKRQKLVSNFSGGKTSENSWVACFKNGSRHQEFRPVQLECAALFSFLSLSLEVGWEGAMHAEAMGKIYSKM